MSNEDIMTDVANHMLDLPPAEFEAWLQAKCPVGGMDTGYGLCLSAYLAGSIGESWARNHASSRVR